MCEITPILPTNKHRNLEDALEETQKTRETGDTGLTWLIGPTVNKWVRSVTVQSLIFF